MLGKIRDEPVHAMIGGAIRDRQPFCATGARPDVAKGLGLAGGKMSLHHGPDEGADGCAANIELAGVRAAVGDDFPLMWDGWMSLDLDCAVRLAHAAGGLLWIEEPLLPDDYWGYRDLRAAVPPGLLVTTGEHEATRWGFQLLLQMGCTDIIPPDVGRCGGVTELPKISARADAHDVAVVPHGWSVCSYQFVMTRRHSPLAELLMMTPGADEVTPMFHPLLPNEPTPIDGWLSIGQWHRPGFGVELNANILIHRPYPR